MVGSREKIVGRAEQDLMTDSKLLIQETPRGNKLNVILKGLELKKSRVLT